MDRKLLPYEHQLIEALGVTKEEYLNFVNIQREYQDPKVGTQLDVRNADPGTQALVLTVIGILFQVASALLMPKPQVPDIDQRRKRQERFAPTFGFNAAQELAVYNDPVNLVYTNTDQNKAGGVRVAGSLVWSELESFGSSQYMTMLLVLGASVIKEIDPDLTAFGQIAIKDLDPALIFLFYKTGQGPVTYQNIVFGIPEDEQNSITSQKIKYLPPSLKENANSHTKVARLRPQTSKETEGFSQAYTPTTAISFGAYDPIPIFVEQYGRDKDGDQKDAPNGVNITGNDYPGQGARFNLGDNLELNFENRELRKGDDDVAENAADLREQYVNSIDYGATYMLGTAKFRLKSISNNSRNLANRVSFTFECIEAGHKPSTEYSKTELIDRQETDFNLNTFINYRNILKGNDQQNRAFSINNLGINANFLTTKIINWVDSNGEKQEKTVDRRGSISYSEKLRRQENNNKPKLQTKIERAKLNKAFVEQQNLIEDIIEGKYDVYKDAPSETDAARKLSTNIENALNDDQILIDLKQKINNLKDDKVQIEQSNKSNEIKKRKLNDVQKLIDKEQENVLSRQQTVRAAQRRPYIDTIRNAIEPYTAIDGVEYITGTKNAENLLAERQVADNLITDQIGADAIQKFYDDLIEEKKTVLDRVEDIIATWDTEIIRQNSLGINNKSFFTKCLVKAESASYETVSEVDIVKFSFKTTLYRRISGRQRKYGDQKTSFSTNDNGVKTRTAFFRVKFKKIQDTHYNVFPVVFAVKQRTESSFYGQLNFEPNEDRQKWQFKFEPVYDLVAEIANNSQKGVGFIESEGTPQQETELGVTWTWFGRKAYGFAFDGFPAAYQGSRGPKLTHHHDMFTNSSDTQTDFSFNNGPEFTLAGVTEQQIASGTSEKHGLDYNGLTTLGMIVRAGRGIEDLRSITACVKKGKASFVVPNEASLPFVEDPDSTSYAPDIFVDTALDKTNGAGKYVPSHDAVLDKESLVLAKKFCKNNAIPVENGNAIQLFFDGIIADVTSWREFWITNAPFSLLEFVRKNGRDALIPAIPTDNSGRATTADGRPVPVQISALFTAGNILENSYKEEFLDYGPTTQDIVATVTYKDTNEDSVFDKKATVEVKLNNVDRTDAVAETFDASNFVTQKEQAIMIGKLLVNQRRYIRRGIEFKTFPSQNPLEPGSFIYVDVGNTNWDNYSSGIVMDGGQLNTPLHDVVKNGTYDFLVFNHKQGATEKLSNQQVIYKTASGLTNYVGWLFVMGTPSPSKRVFRITEVALDEEGEVTVKAMEYPCDNELRPHVADFRSSNFDVS